MKKAQIPSQLFVFVIGVVIVGAILLFGYKMIFAAQDSMSKSELVTLKNNILNDVNTIGSDFGTIKKVKYSVSSTTVCFVDLDQRTSVLSSESIGKYPLMKDSIDSDSNDNVFIFDTSLLHSFDSGNIEIENSPYFFCVDSEGDGLGLVVEGRGNGVIISTEISDSEESDESVQSLQSDDFDDNINDIDSFEDDLSIDELDELDSLLDDIVLDFE